MSSAVISPARRTGRDRWAGENRRSVFSGRRCGTLEVGQHEPRMVAWSRSGTAGRDSGPRDAPQAPAVGTLPGRGRRPARLRGHDDRRVSLYPEGGAAKRAPSMHWHAALPQHAPRERQPEPSRRSAGVQELLDAARAGTGASERRFRGGSGRTRPHLCGTPGTIKPCAAGAVSGTVELWTRSARSGPCSSPCLRPNPGRGRPSPQRPDRRNEYIGTHGAPAGGRGLRQRPGGRAGRRRPLPARERRTPSGEGRPGADTATRPARSVS